MDLRLFLVMTLISVHVSAQLHGESSTMVAELNTPEQKETTSVSENQTVSNTTENQTTESSFNVNTSLTPQKTTLKDTGSFSTSKSPAVEKTEVSTPLYVEFTTKQSQERIIDATSSTNVETTTLSSNKIDSTMKLSTEDTTYRKDETSTVTPVEKQQDVTTILSSQESTKTMNNGTHSTVKAGEIATTTTYTKDHGTTSTVTASEKTSTELSPEEFFKWLDSIEQKNQTDTNVTKNEETNNKINTNTKTTEMKNSVNDHNHHHHTIDPNRMPPKEFFEWLDSIHPDSNTTTVKNIIDTSIISTGKLIIVISTICGTFVLFVAILIAISCCRRKRNLRNDSEKSDFSMNSVISIPEKRNSLNSDIFSPDKNGFNNVFMGIPANNEVWKKLEQLSPTASAIMPESTKM